MPQSRLVPRIVLLATLLALTAPAQRITYLSMAQAFDLAPAPGPTGFFNLQSTDILSFVQGPGTPGVIPHMNCGDIATNQVLDTTWVTDGTMITEFYNAPYGFTMTRFFNLSILANPIWPNLVMGMGCDSATGTLWMTASSATNPNFPQTLDGAQLLVAMTPQPLPAPPVFSGPVVLALPVGVMALDIDYDPFTDTLFLAASNGLVYWVATSGAILGSFQPACLSTGPGPWFPLGGIAVETTSPTPTTLYVQRQGVGGASGGVRCLAGGALAPPVFWFPFPYSAGCGLSSNSSFGITFNARPLRYGGGSPGIDTIGEGTDLNSAITVFYGNPGGPAGAPIYLLMSPGGIAPGFQPDPAAFLTLQVDIFNPSFLYFLTATLPGTAGVNAGTAALTFMLPPPGIIPPGTFVFLQWVALTGTGGFVFTQGMLSTYSRVS